MSKPPTRFQARAQQMSAPQPQDFYSLLEQAAPKTKTIYTKDGQGRTVQAESKIKVRVKPIAIGIPFDEIVFSRWVMNYLSLAVMPWDSLLFASSTYLPEARNIIHENFLTSGLEYLLMLDSDVCPPSDVIGRLMAHKKPMVGGWYRRKTTGAEVVVYDLKGRGENGKYEWTNRAAPGKGLEKVDGAGAGCWLMHRDVAKAIGPKPYDMERGGEDLGLCLRVHEAGFDTWIDWDIWCAHVGTAFS